MARFGTRPQPAAAHDCPVYEFHVSRAARDRYEFDQALFGLSGNVVLANFRAVRAFAQRMNQSRNLARHPEQAIHPGELGAMGLIDEILHYVASLYRRQIDPRAFTRALAHLDQHLGRAAVDRTLRGFTETFPPIEVYRAAIAPQDWLAGETGGVTHREVALEELLMLWLANANPAFRPFQELFDDTALGNQTDYAKVIAAIQQFFAGEPPFGPDHQSLPDMLRSPAIAVPHSLSGQLRYIRERWGKLLGDFLDRLLLGLDVLGEEERARWLRFAPPVGSRPMSEIYDYRGLELEAEHFSRDRDWMPRVVLMAKSAYVWLHQLSKQHGRAIDRLDQIPDQELDRLSGWGLTGLWLIGLWERSRASQRIKQMCGNPEAAASAYSLLDYRIADDLGGDEAYRRLQERAARRGIRLASDMVPNHMGIDSRWVIEHPDWFLALDYTPFPSYTFHGADLSSDGHVSIHIEDHYYDRSDAAVVFKRVDRDSGSTRYIYHGNDGTSMPWNDTAQLNYLNPQVREAVIQTILHVARQFPIIRFDAAMTLAKKHYQRLWFPEPGSGGAIPSRAEHGMSKHDFDAAMPVEFWREVVDRIAVEAPDTLLLAEAFWLMEGYFVRTLGMHRVYNSAFMNMLRDEDNAKYRTVIKNTLEFDPEILKRYVNFMNNPDERTALDQFGKGDKYIGVCTLMATLPGLPMFGHGQIEGYAERYGMEYRRAYHDEWPDQELVARHAREIFPLLHRRHLFAEVDEFLLYDFFTEDGSVNEDVFAFSNRRDSEGALVVYHNRFAETRGWIKTSVGYADKANGRRIRQRTLGEGLDLPHDANAIMRFRDQASGQEYLRYANELWERGLHIALRAYECRAYLDWSVVRADDRRPWAALAAELGGGGTASLDEALLGIELRPVHEALRAVVHAESARRLARAVVAASKTTPTQDRDSSESVGTRPSPGAAETDGDAGTRTLVRDLEARMTHLLEALMRFRECEGAQAAGPKLGSVSVAAIQFRSRLEAALRLPQLESRFAGAWPAEARAVLPSRAADPANVSVWGTVIAWAAVETLGHLVDPTAPDAAAAQLLDVLRLRPVLVASLGELGLPGEDAWRAVARLRVSFAHPSWDETEGGVGQTHSPRLSWLADTEVRWLIGAHEHDGVRWFGREDYVRLIWWMALPELLKFASSASPDKAKLRALEQRLSEMMREADASGYRLDQVLAPLLRGGA